MCCLDLCFPTDIEGGRMDSKSTNGNQNQHQHQHHVCAARGTGTGTKAVPKIVLQEAIILLLSRWYALQMAVQNHWGGCDSLQKSHQLAADLFSLFSESNAPVPLEDLENLLHESMLLTFNTEIEDGSIEERPTERRHGERGS